MASVTLRTAHPIACCYDAFISHAGEDKESFARPLFRELKKHRGMNPFCDKERLPHGQHSPTALHFIMNAAPIGVFILSPELLAKKWPFLELKCFLRRYEASLKNCHDQNEPPPPLLIPVFHRLSWEDCSLDQASFFAKYKDVFDNPEHGFRERVKEKQVTEEQVWCALQAVTAFRGVEKKDGDCPLLVETAKIVQTEYRHYIQQFEDWEYLQAESSSSGSDPSLRYVVPVVCLNTFPTHHSDFSSYVLEDELLGADSAHSSSYFAFSLSSGSGSTRLLVVSMRGLSKGKPIDRRRTGIRRSDKFTVQPVVPGAPRSAYCFTRQLWHTSSKPKQYPAFARPMLERTDGSLLFCPNVKAPPPPRSATAYDADEENDDNEKVNNEEEHQQLEDLPPLIRYNSYGPGSTVSGLSRSNSARSTSAHSTSARSSVQRSLSGASAVSALTNPVFLRAT